MLELLRNSEVYGPERMGVQDILVGGGKILWIGPARKESIGAFNLRERDLEGRRVIPGLIDGHVHLTGGGGEAGAETRVPALDLSEYTLGGVTTVVGVLGTDDTTRTTSELLATARGLNALGLTAYCHAGGYHFPPVTISGTVRGDITHIEAIIGVGELALSDHRSSQPTLDDLLRVASEAHVGGMLTGKAGIVHLHIGDGPRGLDLVRQALAQSELPPRVFNPTHVNRKRALFEEAIALARQGSTIDITAFPVGQDEDAWSAPAALMRYLDSGAPPDRVTVSSDGGGCLPVFDAEGRLTSMDVARANAMAGALAELITLGQPLERVLPAFTSNVAQLLRLASKGRIAVGKDADLVVLAEDGTVRDVMARGQWHVVKGKPTVRGPFEVSS
jgi:beta-aspartyl-dipeptidase (metallo-type)